MMRKPSLLAAPPASGGTGGGGQDWALDVCQFHLDEVSLVTLAADFARYCACFALPLQVLSAKGALTVETETDLRGHFEAFVAMLHSQQVSELIRLAEHAVVLNATMITCTYETHMLAHGHRVVLPYRSNLILRLHEGKWRAAAIANSVLLHMTSPAHKLTE